MAFRWRADGGPTLYADCELGIYFSADDYNNGYMQALAMVKYDGTVFWPPIVKLRSTCNIDITYFPFDDQKCKLKMGSWAYDGFQVTLTCNHFVKAYTAKPVLSGHSKIGKTRVLKTNGSLMKVESIAECSKRAFCNTFDLH